MNIIQIPKKSGKLRTIYVPSKEEKNSLRLVMGEIADNAHKLDRHNVMHGFVYGRSAISNANEHIGYKYTTCFDLRDFFDSVHPEHVKGRLSRDIINKVFVDGAARQGLPTSPAVANVAGAAMDEAIVKFLHKNNLGEVKYTRYADDLTFSYNIADITTLLKKRIPEIVSNCGFKINPSKTRTMFAGAGRRIITGVAVDDDIHPTRSVNRKLRAARHNWLKNNTVEDRNKYYGLLEWSKCKLPAARRDYKEELQKLKTLWKINNLNIDKIPIRSADEWYADDVVITGDPIYILGMSSFTGGSWTSCMAWPKGRYRRTTIGYVYTVGIRIALLLSDKVITIGGVSRRQILARTIIADCEDGFTYRRSFYGNDKDVSILENVLVNNGINKCRNKIVKGYSPVRYPYLDQFSSYREGDNYRLKT